MDYVLSDLFPFSLTHSTQILNVIDSHYKQKKYNIIRTVNLGLLEEKVPRQ